MQLKVVLFVVLLTLVSNSNGETIWGKIVASIINVALKMILKNLQIIDNLTLIASHKFVIPEDWDYLLIGSLKLENTEIRDLGSIEIIDCVAKDISVSDESGVQTSISVDLIFNNLELRTKYDVDVGIIDQIPLYGVGEIKIALSKVRVTVNLNLNMAKDLSKKAISGLKIQLNIHDSPSYITGFWKNEEASNIMTGAINILEKQFCMWLDYESAYINGAMSKILEFVINLLLSGSRTISDHDDYECIKDNKYNILKNLENMALYYENGTFPQYFMNNATRRDLKILYTDISQAIIDILKRNEKMKKLLWSDE